MRNLTKLTLTSTALIALLTATSPAFASNTKCDTGAMMADDAMMSDDAMGKDAMMSDDSMKSDDMAMADDAMMEYTVKKGDSLSSIAASELCDANRYNEIADANKEMMGKNMMIEPGQVLHIPAH